MEPLLITKALDQVIPGDRVLLVDSPSPKELEVQAVYLCQVGEEAEVVFEGDLYDPNTDSGVNHFEAFADGSNETLYVIRGTKNE